MILWMVLYICVQSQNNSVPKVMIDRQKNVFVQVKAASYCSMSTLGALLHVCFYLFFF